MNRLLAQDLLEVGTGVLVGNREGKVVAVTLEDTSSNSGGKVAVHRVAFTHRRKKGFGKTYRLVPLARTVTIEVNYASIRVISNPDSK